MSLKNLTIFILALLLSACSVLPTSWRSPASAEEKTNKVAILDTFRAGMQSRYAHFQAEQKGIYALHFIVREDTAGLAYLSMLREAAKRGLKVRLVFDYWASLAASSKNRLTPGMVRALEREGIEIQFFQQFPKSIPKRFGDLQQWTRRMHAKLLTFEGQEAFFVGDRDIGGSYYGFKARGDRFGSGDILINGPESHQAINYVKEMLDSELTAPFSPEITEIPEPSESEVQKASKLLDQAQNNIQSSKIFSKNFRIKDWVKNMTPVDRVDFFAETPNKSWKNTTLLHMFEDISRANEKITIQSPYVIGNKESFKAFDSAQQNQANVEILTNNVYSTDEPYVPPQYDSTAQKLLKRGVEVWEANPDRDFNSARQIQVPADRHTDEVPSSTLIYHKKQAVIDNRITWVSTTNLDNRSLKHDTEVAVRIEDEEFAKKMNQSIDQDRKYFSRVRPNRKPLRYRSCKDLMKYFLTLPLKPIL